MDIPAAVGILATAVGLVNIPVRRIFKEINMPVLFENKQWRVTDYGIESNPGVPTYEIGAKRLTETTDRSAGTFYDWPLHMAEKTWVDVTAFQEAFVRALELHKGSYEPVLDTAILEASLARGLKEAARRF